MEPHARVRQAPRPLAQLLDQYHLVGKPLGTRQAEDAWVDHLSRTIFEGTAEAAAEAAAAALAEGMAPADVGEAISLAANQLILRDAGRTAREAQQNKPVGSVHGDSIGVHACDSANAWRNMAKVSNPRNTVACLILGAYQVAYDRVNRGGDFLHWSARPLAADLEPIRERRPEALLDQLDAAVRANDQARACAVAHRLGALDHSPRACLRPALELRRHRGRCAPRREILSDRDRGVRHDSPGFPLAPARRAGTSDGQRVRPAGTGSRGGPRAARHRLIPA